MPHDPPRKLLIGALILVLHLPLVGYVLWLYPQMERSRSILDLPLLALLLVIVLMALPYVVLYRLAPSWNPERSRIGEYDL